MRSVDIVVLACCSVPLWLVSDVLLLHMAEPSTVLPKIGLQCWDEILGFEILNVVTSREGVGLMAWQCQISGLRLYLKRSLVVSKAVLNSRLCWHTDHCLRIWNSMIVGEGDLLRAQLLSWHYLTLQLTRTEQPLLNESEPPFCHLLSVSDFAVSVFGD